MTDAVLERLQGNSGRAVETRGRNGVTSTGAAVLPTGTAGSLPPPSASPLFALPHR